MIEILAWLGVGIGGLVLGFSIGGLIGEEKRRLWQHIEDLEADKRALTESLCRATGKPFIPAGPKEHIASSGWFDAKPTITVTADSPRGWINTTKEQK